MKKIIGLVVFVVLLAYNTKTYAVYGCLVGNTLYTSQNGGVYPGVTYFDYVPAINASGYCLRTNANTTPCQLRWWTVLWFYGSQGVYGDYGPSAPPLYCPIDKEAIYLVPFVACVGFLFIRNRHLS